MTKIEKENLNLKMELMTIIMGYENELLQVKREEISKFSKGCMERYYDLGKEVRESDIKEVDNVRISKD